MTPFVPRICRGGGGFLLHLGSRRGPPGLMPECVVAPSVLPAPESSGNPGLDDAPPDACLKSFDQGSLEGSTLPENALRQACQRLFSCEFAPVTFTFNATLFAKPARCAPSGGESRTNFTVWAQGSPWSHRAASTRKRTCRFSLHITSGHGGPSGAIVPEDQVSHGQVFT